jgi:hypothetical protein
MSPGAGVWDPEVARDAILRDVRQLKADVMKQRKSDTRSFSIAAIDVINLFDELVELKAVKRIRNMINCYIHSNSNGENKSAGKRAEILSRNH